MNASVHWDKDILIVELSGTLDFDKAYEFRKKSLRHFMQNKVIFTIKNLAFVGSTGMSSFIETLSEISQKNPNGLGVCGAGIEYERLLKPFLNERFKIFQNITLAKNFYVLSEMNFVKTNQS